jgi:hypothetical protein
MQTNDPDRELPGREVVFLDIRSGCDPPGLIPSLLSRKQWGRSVARPNTNAPIAHC